MFVTPIAGMLLLGVLIVLLRWAFSRGSSVVARRPRQGSPTDYGLLTPIAFPGTEAAAATLVARLAEHNIRSTFAPTEDGIALMVWPQDATSAITVLHGGRPT